MEGLLSVQEKGVLGKKWKKHYVKIVGAEIQIHKGETPGEIQHKIDIGPGSVASRIRALSRHTTSLCSNNVIHMCFCWNFLQIILRHV